VTEIPTVLVTILAVIASSGWVIRLARRLQLAGAFTDWAKSSLSAHNGNCVEVSGLDGETIRVRDSKHPRRAMLNFTAAEWDAFVGGVRIGEFDRKPQREAN
jgi:Domain of unknown function (DUF397)